MPTQNISGNHCVISAWNAIYWSHVSAMEVKRRFQTEIPCMRLEIPWLSLQRAGWHFCSWMIFSSEDAMNYKMMGKFLSQILIVEAGFMVPALLISLYTGSRASVYLLNMICIYIKWLIQKNYIYQKKEQKCMNEILS